jgi:hypothetical protein
VGSLFGRKNRNEKEEENEISNKQHEKYRYLLIKISKSGM